MKGCRRLGPANTRDGVTHILGSWRIAMCESAHCSHARHTTHCATVVDPCVEQNCTLYWE